MLFLDRVEILGFKSFCDKTLLQIPAGITSIVGPNGCGKSNVVDALNWVLGEQSARTLRSDKMEEVIFNGSRNRKPVNMAQVTLVWKADRENPAAPEVTIARRLFRSGESQYEMNGEICRLKDIHSFFLNEGFDPLAYSILEQGRIEALFLSKPMERRALIEEVAGVAEFKHKKRSAQIKLAENQLQLERIQDVLNEIEKQLSSLKRQAAKARRFQLLKEEKSVLQRILYHRRFAQIQEEYARLLEALRLRMEEEQQALEWLQKKQLIESEMKLRYSELESQLYEDQNKLHQLEGQIHENLVSLQAGRQRIEELKRGIEDKENDNRRLAEEEQRLQVVYESRLAEETQLKSQTEEFIQAHSALVFRLESKTTEVGNLEQRLQEIRNEILELLHSASQLRNDQTRLQTQQDHISESLIRKEEELATTQAARAAHASTMEQEQKTQNRLAEEIGYLNVTEKGILGRCEQFKVEWDALQIRVQAAFKNQSELRQKLQKLDAQQHTSKFYNESARNLLNLPSQRALGMMMDFIETEPQYETAVEHFLADKLNYLIVNEEDSALSAIDYLKQQGLGYCGFIIKNGYSPAPPILPEGMRQETGVLGTLRDIVTIKEDALPAIAPFLEAAVVVSNLECAQGLIKKYPDYQFVTVQGDVILSPAIYAGGAKSDDVPGLIAIQREQKEFAVRMAAADQETETLGEQVRAIQDQLEISNHELGRLREVRESKNKDQLLVQMKIDKVQEDMNREDKQIDILLQEQTRFLNEKEAVQARADQFALQLQEKTVKLEDRDKEIQTIEQQLSTGREEQQQLQRRVNDSSIEIAKLQERDLSLSKELDVLRQRQEAVAESILESRRVVEQKKQEISETDLLCTGMESKRLELVRQRDEQKNTLEKLGKQKEELAERMTAHDGELQAARDHLAGIKEERNNTEISKTRVETQRDDLIARCREEMEVELEELSLPESDWNELTDESLRMKHVETEAKIDRLGSINMLALEEYTQMEERHRFLKSQYEDLKISIATLLETIQRIDATSLKRFQEALRGVQIRFQDLFQRLFQGGKAEMVLIEPENPNESGVDVHVQPPGKRLQNMHLLSGGEKTLTGIAFLLALFQYHTSPFCVMDEVDAALDEVNVQRFTALISEMKQQIQFLIVTHNKRTMEAADQLYGVTMAEAGVSNILSARFEEAEALIEK